MKTLISTLAFLFPYFLWAQSSPTTTPKERPGIGLWIFLTLFLSLFVGIGIFFARRVIRRIHKIEEAKNWAPTEARILHVEMEDDGDTQEIHLKYEYEFRGIRYEQTQIGFGNEVSYNVYDKLKPAKKIIVYVNPRTPQEAVVIRGLTSTLMGSIRFVLVWNLFLVANGIIWALHGLGIKHLYMPVTIGGIGVLILLTTFFPIFGATRPEKQVVVLAQDVSPDVNEKTTEKPFSN